MATFEYREKSRLLVHYSEERARKDESDRIRSLEKLQQKLMKSKDPKSLLSNYGYKKFLKINGHAKVEVNAEKIAESACWDGLAGIITNDEESSPAVLFSHYRGLWQIEESFRINKHDLRMRPIYHWKPQRVKAHIAISFMAFVCVRYLEYIISMRNVKISPEKIRQTLLEVQASTIEDTQSHRAFLLFSTISAQAKKIYQLLGIKLPSCTTEIHCGA